MLELVNILTNIMSSFAVNSYNLIIS